MARKLVNVASGGSRSRWLTGWRAVMLFVFAGLSAPLPVTASGSGLDDAAVESGPLYASRRTLAAWNMGRADDHDFDGWPDRWRRYRGLGYPDYVAAEIADRDPEWGNEVKKIDTEIMRLWPRLRRVFDRLPALPPALTDTIVDRVLRIDLDGGQFKAQSPTLPADPVYRYRLSCQVRTSRLQHDQVYAELVFLDADGNELATEVTSSVGGTTDWTRLTIGQQQPPPNVESMFVRLVVARGEDGLEDIHGRIEFDDVRVERFPQLQVRTDRDDGIYQIGQPITASARVMGLDGRRIRLRFALIDAFDHVLQEKRLISRPDHASEDLASVPELSWRLDALPPGYYRVRAVVAGQPRGALETETSFAVIKTLVEGPPHGPFGWTLPGTWGVSETGKSTESPRKLARRLADLGVAWVKYPCWLGGDQYAHADRIVNVLGRMQDHGIRTVGVLDRPPPSEYDALEVDDRRDLVAATLFHDPLLWQPRLEPIMTRLTLKVRWWQLGGETDYSFLDRPRLRDSIEQIAAGLQGFGGAIQVAISWPWLEETLPDREASWHAVCRSARPVLSAAELDAALDLADLGGRREGPDTWLVLDPLDADRYDQTTRIQDLVMRMATVRGHRVQNATVSRPTDPRFGLLCDDGRPGPLLLPWRTTAQMLGNLRRVGSLRLASGAENFVFVGGGRAVVLLTAPQSRQESIYLGEDVKIVDVWGDVKDAPTVSHPRGPRQQLNFGPLPIFVTGADPDLLALRMSVQVSPKQFDSLLGQSQELSISYANPLHESLVGSVAIRTPGNWATRDARRNWELLAGGSHQERFEVVLNNSARVGDYWVPIDFKLDTLPPKSFTVHRKIRVGPQGVAIKADTRLLPSGELRVRIELTNRGDRRVTYNCMLFPPPHRQYQSRFVTMAPGQTARREIVWRDGEELVGQPMLLRAVEQDGRRRVMNYPIEVVR